MAQLQPTLFSHSLRSRVFMLLLSNFSFQAGPRWFAVHSQDISANTWICVHSPAAPPMLTHLLAVCLLHDIAPNCVKPSLCGCFSDWENKPPTHTAVVLVQASPFSSSHLCFVLCVCVCVCACCMTWWHQVNMSLCCHVSVPLLLILSSPGWFMQSKLQPDIYLGNKLLSDLRC